MNVEQNTPPYVEPVRCETLHGTPVTGSLYVHDVECDVRTWSVVSGPSHATPTGFTYNTSNDTFSFSYTPMPDFVGTDTFTVKVNDGNFDSNIARKSGDTLLVSRNNAYCVPRFESYSPNMGYLQEEFKTWFMARPIGCTNESWFPLANLTWEFSFSFMSLGVDSAISGTPPSGGDFTLATGRSKFFMWDEGVLNQFRLGSQ